MKLYATLQSERGKIVSKSGNDYIEVNLLDQNRKTIYNVTIMPHDEGHLIIEHHSNCAMVQKRNGGGYFIKWENAKAIYDKKMMENIPF